jgi:YfiH family protein
MLAENELRPDDLRGPGGALWLAEVPAFDGVAVAFTTRETTRQGPAADFTGPAVGADGKIQEEYVARLCATVGFAYGRLTTCRQVHGTTIRAVATAQRQWCEECDGLATALPEAPLAVFTADCVPVVLWAPRERALAVLHAGWRGTLAKIVAAGVSFLEREWGAAPATVAMFLGPGVGPCCYDVGADVASAAEEAFGKRLGQVLTETGGARRLDLARANELVGQEAGLLPDNIYRLATCTACEAELFASWRREGEAAGRQMAVAAVSEAASQVPKDEL